jgi:hypothetical protein
MWRDPPDGGNGTTALLGANRRQRSSITWEVMALGGGFRILSA